MIPTLVTLAIAAILTGGWRARRRYLALFEDTEVPRRQIQMLVLRRERLTTSLEATVSEDETEATEVDLRSDLDDQADSMRADLEDVLERLAAVEHIRELTLVTYGKRVSPTLARLLFLPRSPR